MSEMVSFINSCLVTGEQIFSLVENLHIGFVFVPLISPQINTAGGLKATLVLTNLRIIVVFFDGTCYKLFHVSSINSLTERPLTASKPNWPYQAILGVPGGMAIIVQTHTPNLEHAKQLSNLVVKGFLRFGVRRDDDGAQAAIIAYEEQKRREQDNDSPKKKE